MRPGIVSFTTTIIVVASCSFSRGDDTPSVVNSAGAILGGVAGINVMHEECARHMPDYAPEIERAYNAWWAANSRDAVEAKLALEHDAHAHFPDPADARRALALMDQEILAAEEHLRDGARRMSDSGLTIECTDYFSRKITTDKLNLRKGFPADFAIIDAAPK